MIHLTYDPTSGEILTWGDGAPNPPAPGAMLMEDVADGVGAWTHYVRDGALVAYTDAQRAVKTAFPDVPSVWSNVTFAWQTVDAGP